MAKSIAQEFTKGLWNDIPPFRLVLGLCPVLAVTKTIAGGIGMGLATTFVLVASNFLVSLLRKVIPAKVRIACFIIIIATFVTIVKFALEAYAFDLYNELGMFIPLIVVNCIVLGRSEAFAYKNPIVPSIADGLGMGLGFTLSLGTIGAVREILGTGNITFAILGQFKYEATQIFGSSFEPFTFFIEAPGAFVCVGLLLCAMNLIGTK